jgi:hypothetical protein
MSAMLVAAVASTANLTAQTPRLVPINVQLTTGTSYCAGESITVAYDVCNNGNAPVFPNVSWSDRVVVSTSRDSGGIIASRTIRRRTGNIGMPPGACYSQFNPPINLPTTISIPSTAHRGTHFVGYEANFDNALPGGSTTTWVQINVETQPDFTGSNFQVSTSPLLPGGPIDTSFAMNNQGGNCRNGFMMGAVYIAPRGVATRTRLGTTPLTNIPAGTSRNFGGTLTVPSQFGFGDYDLILVVDDGNAVLESNESNNEVTIPICLGPLASYASFGVACPGINNQTLTLQPSALAHPGTALTMDATGGTAGLLGILFLGLAPAGVDLSPICMPGCWLNVAPLSSEGALFDAAGSHGFPFAIPNDSALIGASVFVQVAGQSPGANCLGFITSQGGQVTIGC